MIVEIKNHEKKLNNIETLYCGSLKTIFSVIKNFGWRAITKDRAGKVKAKKVYNCLEYSKLDVKKDVYIRMTALKEIYK